MPCGSRRRKGNPGRKRKKRFKITKKDIAAGITVAELGAMFA
jgi:hypothetical protein